MTSFILAVLPAVDKEYVSEYCRACSCKLKNSGCEIDNNPAKPELPLLLKRYVPEFDVKVANACLCTDCVSILYVFHDFKRKCLRTEENLRLHLRQKPEVKTVNINEVFDPEKSITPKLLHWCKVCGKGFAEKSMLPVHMKVKHKESHRSALNCTLCDRIFWSQKSLMNHINSFHGRARYQCDQCSRDFTFKHIYDKHLEYHKRPDSDRFMCKVCNFVYTSHSSLYRHNIGRHKSENNRPFGCKICPKRFTEKSTLTAHMRVHTGERPFKCNLCPYAARHKSVLNKHLRLMHNDTKSVTVLE